jgi:hypothetical protein
LWSALAVPPARPAHAQRPERATQDDAVDVLVAAQPGAVRAGHLLGQAATDLFLDHHFLNLPQQLVDLSQLRAERVNLQGTPLQLRHLVHGRWTAVVGFDDLLHSDPHCLLPSPAPASSANLRLTLVAAGRGNDEIAADLFFRQATVKTHVSRAMLSRIVGKPAEVITRNPAERIV